MERGQNESLWYDRNGNFDPLDDSEVKNVPMPFDPFFVGKLSGCATLESFTEWFSPRLQYKLLQTGYKMYRIAASDVIYLETQVLIPSNKIISREEIPYVI